MRRALPGSALVHAAVLGAALVGFAWSEAEDAPAAESVSVSIITMSSVSSNATEVVQSDSTNALVSSGSANTTPPVLDPVEPDTVEPITETLEAIQPETEEALTEPPVDPLPPEPSQAIAETTAEPLPPEVIEPLETAVAVAELQPEAAPVAPTADLAVLSATAVSGLASQPVAAHQPDTIEPVSSRDLKIAPVPQTLSRPRTSTPTYPKPQSQRPAPRQATTPPPGSAGNGGSSNADAVASAGTSAPQAGAGNGEDAEVAKYPSEVLRKLRRSLRSNSGPAGEVIVRFTVLASGQVTGIGIGRSSGNSAVDRAGLATVTRAAPFPAIPPAANRSSWIFDVPLAFGG